MTSPLTSQLLTFTNPQDAVQLRDLEAMLALALAEGLSQADKAALLGVFERFPEEDGFGVFWSIVHGLEAADNYEHELVASIRRLPGLFNTLMLNRIANTGSQVVAGEPIDGLLAEVANRNAVAPAVVKQVSGFLRRRAPARGEA